MYRVDMFVRVCNVLIHLVHPGHRRWRPPRRPKLAPYTEVIVQILDKDLGFPRKQRHTAKGNYDRLREEYGSQARTS